MPLSSSTVAYSSKDRSPDRNPLPAMSPSPSILKRRRPLLFLALAAAGVFAYFSFHPLGSRYTNVAATLPNVRKDAVIVFESAIHDEVNGALGNSLVLAGFDPLFICSFRYDFEMILGNLTYPLVPRIQSPYRMPKEVSVESRIDRGEVDVLVLTTCSQALPKLLSHLEPTNTKVVCVVHHSGQPAYRDLKPLIVGLAKQRRIGLLVLGEHVRQRLHSERLQWAEREAEDAWLDMPIEVLVPTFDYPAKPTTPSPAIFPSRVVIQGNIEPGRRKYDAVLRHLTEAMTANPSNWGWKYDSALEKFVQDSSGSPFTLHLLGRRNEQHPVEIKKEIEDVVHIHPDLSYPQFYEFLNGVDLIVPAFGQNGPYEDTASSSIAAAVIVRVPALVTERHLNSYTYLAPPAIVTHSVVESEIAAIERLRTSGDQWQLRRASAKDWRRYQGRLDSENVETWGRVLRTIT
ncbi:hypothetical protein BCR39DRAFT_512928 [Naematelia encephala]|uniref:Glycosyl transferase family 1 domain-containing protein n=1 Tax=Naematelia encephala TaxID=71784 RepID=A0A1Y2BMH8_9TREE|nr:hypothetical protein BCR39DRAFT_512928 [Naematelia encephala]